MNNFKKYILEYLLILAVMAITITGFWKIYFGADADPTLYQNLHVITNLIWLSLLLFQLRLIGKYDFALHKRVGLSILFFGPLLVATTALLSVYSAYKGVVSGEGDVLIVQNVMGTLELGLIILLAFIFKKRTELHAASMLSTAVLFMGIALFFTFLAFVPQFKIEGPETFYRFGMAAASGQLVCLVVSIIFLIKDWRNGWPYLLATLSFIFNHFINMLLIKYELIQPVTEFIGSLNQIVTFLVSFAILLMLLLIILKPIRPRLARSPQSVEPAV